MKKMKKHFSGKKSETGVTLLVVIIAMVVVALIGTGLFALFFTSSLNQAEAQKTAKANYLAESGIRLAASEFLHAPDQNQMLADLQDKIFNIAGTGGSFKLHLYPYWFYVTNASAAGATSIKLYLPGNPGTLPPINSDSSTGMDHVPPGILKLKNMTQVGVFTNAPIATDANGTYVTFAVSSYYPCPSSPCTGFPYAIAEKDALFIGYTYTSPQAVTQGGNLVLNDPDHTAGMYPPNNGAINITKTDYIYQYTYESRIPQTIDPGSPPATFTLTNIQPAPGVIPTPIFPIQIIYNDSPAANRYDPRLTTQIYIGATLAIRSTAEYVN
jgi:type II secretory pathway pseudopilin PulG